MINVVIIALAVLGQAEATFVNVKGASRGFLLARASNWESGEPVGTCPETQGLEPVYLPDARNCEYFYECDAAGEAVLFKCAPGTVWDTDCPNCCSLENISCLNGPTTTPTPSTPPNSSETPENITDADNDDNSNDSASDSDSDSDSASSPDSGESSESTESTNPTTRETTPWTEGEP